MAAEADSLADQVEQLAEKLEDLDAPGAARGARRGADEARAGARSMRSAQADAATEQMERAASELARAGDSLAESWRADAMRAVEAATSEALELAREQQEVVERLRSGARPEDLASDQTAIREGLDNLTQSLAEAGKQTALLDRRSGPAAAAAGREMDAVGQSLAGSSSRREEGVRQGEAAMEALSDLAGSLMASGRAMSEASSATGMEEALERMAGASRNQAGVNSESGDLFLLMQGGEPADGSFRELGGRQRAISEELRRIAEDPKLRELTGRPGELAREADELAREITAGNLNPETLARQEQLFRRLLDAGRSLEKDEEEARRREATSARPGVVFLPDEEMGLERGLRYPYPGADAMEGLTATQRRIVYDYFDRLNAGSIMGTP